MNKSKAKTTALALLADMLSLRMGGTSAYFKRQRRPGLKKVAKGYRPHQGRQERLRRISQRERGLI